MLRRSRSALALSAILLIGCGREGTVTGIDPGPEPCAGLATFACGVWSGCPPASGVAEFDLHVLSSTAAEAIRLAGGTVLHEYHVTLIRARLPVTAVTQLYSDQQVWTAMERRPGDPLDFDAVIAMPTPLSAADRAFLDSAGVVVLQEWDYDGTGGLDFIRATVIDGTVPTIRMHAGVRDVWLNGRVCITN